MIKFVGCALAVVGAVAGCAFGYHVLSYVVAAVVAAQRPAPVRGAA